MKNATNEAAGGVMACPNWPTCSSCLGCTPTHCADPTAGVAIPAVAVEMVCRESMCANMERCQFPHACREQPRTDGVAACETKQEKNHG